MPEVQLRIAESEDVSGELSGRLSFALAGDLDFNNAVAIREQGRAAIQKADGGALQVDVSGLRQSGSVLFSLLIRWLSDATRQGLTMRVGGLSTYMMDVARISGLEDVLPITTNPQ